MLQKKYTKIFNIPVSKNMLKKLHSGINEEGYHHRDLFKKTWTNAYFDENKINIDLNNTGKEKYINFSFYKEIKDFYINNEIDPNAPILDKIEHLLNEILLVPVNEKS